MGRYHNAKGHMYSCRKKTESSDTSHMHVGVRHTSHVQRASDTRYITDTGLDTVIITRNKLKVCSNRKMTSITITSHLKRITKSWRARYTCEEAERDPGRYGVYINPEGDPR